MADEPTPQAGPPITPLTPVVPQFVELTTLDPPVNQGVKFWLNANHLLQVFQFDGKTVIRTTADAFHPKEPNEHLIRVQETPAQIVSMIWQKPMALPLPALP